MPFAAASRYARALTVVVSGPGAGIDGPAALEQIQTFARMLKESPELKAALITPAVKAARKRAVVGRLADQLGFAGVIKNFLFLVVDHRRIEHFGELAVAFEAALDERLGRVRAAVKSAAALTPDQQNAVAQQLSKVTGKQVRCEFSVEPELIGGVLAQVGSTIYDGSVRGQLENLRHRLIPE